MPRQVEWLNANRYRSYPFIENADLTAAAIEILDSVILDFRGVNYVVATTPLRLTSLQILAPVGPRVGNFTFAFDGAPAPFDEFTVSVPENASFPFESTVTDSAIQHMTCVFGRGVVDLLQNTAGTYALDTPPQVEPALVSFQDKHRVSSIVASGVGQDELTGEVYLEEGYNCAIRLDTARNRATISAVKGAGAGISCDRMSPAVVLCSEVLLRINGLRAGDLGDFMILPGDGVEIEPDPDNNRIIIRGMIDRDNLECG